AAAPEDGSSPSKGALLKAIRRLHARGLRAQHPTNDATPTSRDARAGGWVLGFGGWGDRESAHALDQSPKNRKPNPQRPGCGSRSRTRIPPRNDLFSVAEGTRALSTCHLSAGRRVGCPGF